jgi:hypothetical protein
MSLSPNPIATLVNKVASETKELYAAAAEGIPKEGFALEKAKLDAAIAQASGAIGSGLNQASSGGIINAAQTAMGNAADTISSKVGTDSITSLAENVGAVPGVGDITKAASGSAISDVVGKISSLTGGGLASGVKSIASNIANAAGDLNDLLSLKRAENLPKDGELFASTGEGIQVTPNNGGDWRVKISCDWSLFPDNALFSTLKNTGGVVFPYLPTINFATKANYTQIDPVHNNYPFQAYKNSQVDEINISGRFTAETGYDAFYWLAATTFFKTATKMFFGQSANAGAPPIICTLSGYGTHVFDHVPVVIKSFSVDFPNDVNYVKADTNDGTTWVPIASDISVIVQPVYNRRNLRSFSLQEYAKGTLRTPTDKGYA